MHSCPECGLHCHCGGDIDDLWFDDTLAAKRCWHCPDHSEDDRDDDMALNPDWRDPRDEL